MINNILRYDEFEIKKIIEQSNNDFTINTKKIKNAEIKILEINDILKKNYGESNYKLAVCLLTLSDRYGDFILENLKNLKFINHLENLNAFLLFPPENLFTKQKPILKESLISLSEDKPIIMLHELRHFLTSLKDNNYYLDEKIFYQRVGLTKTIITQENNINNIKNYGIGLDEVCNVYQSEQLMNDFLSLRNYNFKNIEISNLMNSIKNPYKAGYKDNSYYNLSLLMTPLLKNKDFIKLTDYYANNGNLKMFESDFNMLYNEYTNYLIFEKNIDLFMKFDNENIINNKEEIFELKKLILNMSKTKRKL